VRQIAKGLDRPPTVIPARWNAVWPSVGHLHHARVGVTAKTLANHKANVRAALRWFGNEHDAPQHRSRGRGYRPSGRNGQSPCGCRELGRGVSSRLVSTPLGRTSWRQKVCYRFNFAMTAVDFRHDCDGPP
jgi:hypothetical protein